MRRWVSQLLRYNLVLSNIIIGHIIFDHFCRSLLTVSWKIDFFPSSSLCKSEMIGLTLGTDKEIIVCSYSSDKTRIVWWRLVCLIQSILWLFLCWLWLSYSELTFQNTYGLLWNVSSEQIPYLTQEMMLLINHGWGQGVPANCCWAFSRRLLNQQSMGW